MDKNQFAQAYYTLTQREISPMVNAQVNRLLASSGGYGYQEVYQAIWHLMKIKGIPASSFDTYGIGLLTSNERNMQEALLYMENLKETRKNAATSAREAKNKEVSKVRISRQKRKIKREEFKWDE